jgi:protein-disulfide isomerase
MKALFLRSLALACAVAVAGPVSAQTASSAIGPEQKSQIETIIHDYLLKNPEVLREAMVELDRRQKASEAAARDQITLDTSGPLYSSPYQMVIGNPKGDVTLVEFFDYNCGYCKRALSDNLKLLEQDKNLRIILKEFPVLGPGSVEASRVAMAARMSLKPEQVLQFHAKLLGARGPANKQKALEVAKEVGIDPVALAKQMDSTDVSAGIQQVAMLADQLGLTGTPSFVFGGEVVVGAVGFDELKDKIDSVRKCGKASCS